MPHSTTAAGSHEAEIGALVVGATGRVGRAVAASLREAGYAVTETSRRPDAARSQLHFTLGHDDPALLKLDFGRYRYCVIAAGVTRADVCERDVAASRAVNVDGTIALVERLWSADVMPVWFSSDYVFDGRMPPGADGEPTGYTEDSPVAPLNEYGRQKVEVERFLASSGRPHLVLRLGRVVSDRAGSGCLLDEVCARLLSGARYQAAVDQVFSMIDVAEIGRFLDLAFRAELRGLFHVAAPDAMSRFEVVSRLARELDLDAAQVVPCRLAEVSDVAQRPLNTALNGLCAARELGFAFTEPAKLIARAASSHRLRRLVGSVSTEIPREAG